jgi:aspartate aminotransferase
MVEEFKRRRERLKELTCDIAGFECYVPDGAFYIFPKIDSFFGKSHGDDVINNADDLSMYLLNKAHVSTVTGRAFGQPDCIRLSFANSMENIEKGIARIKEALEKLA